MLFAIFTSWLLKRSVLSTSNKTGDRMKQLFIVAASLLFSACASPEQIHAQASRASDDELCLEIARHGEHSNVARDELRLRSVQCDWARISALANIRAQRSAAAEAAVYQYMNTLQAQTNALNAQAQSQRQINCRSQNMGGYVNTYCY